MRTALCDRLEIEFPIFAFSHCRDVVAAVSRAGGFGVLGALGFPPEQLETELRWIEIQRLMEEYLLAAERTLALLSSGGSSAG